MNKKPTKTKEEALKAQNTFNCLQDNEALFGMSTNKLKKVANDFHNYSVLRKKNPDTTDQFPIEEGITVKIGGKSKNYKLNK